MTNRSKLSLVQKTASLVLIAFFANSTLPAFSEEISISAADVGYVFLDEDFEDANVGDAIASEESCLEGWSYYISSSKTNMDSYFTVVQEASNEGNMVGEAKRSKSNGDSKEVAMVYCFEEAVDGGTVEFQMRINRADQRLKVWDVIFYDTAETYVDFQIRLDKSLLKVGDDSFYFYDEDSGEQLSSDTKYKTNQWLTFKISINLENNCFDFYQGQYRLAQGVEFTNKLNGQLGKVLMRTARNMSASSETVLYMDDIKLTRTAAKPTAEEKMAAAKAEVLSYITENLSAKLTDDVVLPEKIGAAELVWKSDNEEVINNIGVITQKWQEEQKASLTITITCAGLTEVVTQNVTIDGIWEKVAPTQTLIENAIEKLSFSDVSDNSVYGVKDDLDLKAEFTDGVYAVFGGVDAVWTSSPSGIIDSEGKLTKTKQIQSVTLTAKLIAKDDEAVTAEKSFSLTVLQQGITALYETFDKNILPKQEINGYNGWSEEKRSGDSYLDDTVITAEKTGEDSNMAMQIYREKVESSTSAQIVAVNTLKKTLEGGKVNIRFRLKRNDEAKRLDIFLGSNEVRLDISKDVLLNEDNAKLVEAGNGLKGSLPTEVWRQIELVVDYDENLFDFYIINEENGEKEFSCEGLPMGDNDGKLATIGFATDRQGRSKTGATFLIDDLFVMQPKSLLEMAIEEISFSDISDNSAYGVKDDLKLKTEYTGGSFDAFGGADALWTSSPEGIIDAQGRVTKTTQVQNVALTAKFTAKNDETVTAEKSFSLTVLPQGKSFVYETFEKDSVPKQEINGYNGWSEASLSNVKYVDDTVITIENEGGTDNAAMQIYREDVDGETEEEDGDPSSAMIVATKNMEETIDGGRINIRFRLRRNDGARCLYIYLDGNEFRIDIEKNVLKNEKNEELAKAELKTALPKDMWRQIELVIDYDQNLIDFYIINEKSGEKLLSCEKLPMGENSAELGSIGFSTDRYGRSKAGAIFLMDDLFVIQTKEKTPDGEATELVADALYDELNGKTVSEDLALSTKGSYRTTVLWASSDTETVNITGEYGIVTQGDADKAVTLTATVIKGKEKEVIEIPVTVTAFPGAVTPTQELLDTAAERFAFSEISDESPYMITGDLTLPTEYNKGTAQRIGGASISWKSSMPNVMDNNGKITKQKYDTYLTLTATISAKDNPNLTVQKEFTVCAAAEGEFILNDDFEDADFETEMYEPFDETCDKVPGSRSKIIYKDWLMTADSDTKEVNTDLQVVYFPDNPYNTVFNYTRAKNTKTGDVPVTYSYKDFDKAYNEGILYVTARFYLTGTSSRITMGLFQNNEVGGGSSVNCNTVRVANVLKDTTPNEWHTLSMLVYLSGDVSVKHRYDVFLDGVRVHSNQNLFKTGDPITGINISSIRTADGPNANWYVDDVTVRHAGYYNPEDEVSRSAAELTIGAGTITDNIELPAYGDEGTRVLWHSSDKELISDGGIIGKADGRTNATLTATITKGDAFTTKSFPVNVAAEVPCTVTNPSPQGAEVEYADFSGNCVLVTMLYSHGDVKDMRVTSLNASPWQSESVTFANAIDTSAYLSYEIRSYVYDTDNNEVISNIAYGGGN